MKMNRIILFILLLLFTKSFAQENPGARSIALAHANISGRGDPFSLFNNPSLLTTLKNRQIGIFYSPSPFDIKELANGFASYVEPTSYGVFGVGFMVYGFELYKETKFSFGYSKKVYNNFSIGITTSYQRITIMRYGSKGLLMFDLGGTVKLDESIELGFLLKNFTRTTINNYDNQIPVSLSTGINVSPLKQLNLYGALYKELGFSPSIKFGTEYELFDFFLLRFGVSSKPENYSFGFGISFSFVQTEYAVTSHPYLGLTHQFGLIILF